MTAPLCDNKFNLKVFSFEQEMLILVNTLAYFSWSHVKSLEVKNYATLFWKIVFRCCRGSVQYDAQRSVPNYRRGLREEPCL